MKINNKGQMGILGFIFSYIVIFIAWATILHTQVSYWAEKTIINGGLTGTKAFLVSNMNLWIFLGFILGMIIIIYMGKNN